MYRHIIKIYLEWSFFSRSWNPEMRRNPSAPCGATSPDRGGNIGSPMRGAGGTADCGGSRTAQKSRFPAIPGNLLFVYPSTCDPALESFAGSQTGGWKGV